MKLFYGLLLTIFLITGSPAQQATAKAEERMFLPSDTFYGYAHYAAQMPAPSEAPTLPATPLLAT